MRIDKSGKNDLPGCIEFGPGFIGELVGRPNPLNGAVANGDRAVIDDAKPA